MHGEKHKRVECGEEWVTHNTRNNKSGKVCKSCLEELPSKGDKGWRTLGNANVPNVRFMSLSIVWGVTEWQGEGLSDYWPTSCFSAFLNFSS